MTETNATTAQLPNTQCGKCGVDAPPQANFCMNCGAPVREFGDQVEKCEIGFLKVDRAKIRFAAWSIGPCSMTMEAESVTFFFLADASQKSDEFSASHFNSDGAYDQNATSALAALVSKLIKNGWTHTTKGEHWYQHRFHRPCTKTSVDR